MKVKKLKITVSSTLNLCFRFLTITICYITRVFLATLTLEKVTDKYKLMSRLIPISVEGVPRGPPPSTLCMLWWFYLKSNITWSLWTEQPQEACGLTLLEELSSGLGLHTSVKAQRTIDTYTVESLS